MFHLTRLTRPVRALSSCGTLTMQRKGPFASSHRHHHHHHTETVLNLWAGLPKGGFYKTNFKMFNVCGRGSLSQMLKRTECIECSSLHIHTLMKEAAMQHGNQLIRSDTAHSIQTIPWYITAKGLSSGDQGLNPPWSWECDDCFAEPLRCTGSLSLIQLLLATVALC